MRRRRARVTPRCGSHRASSPHWAPAERTAGGCESKIAPRGFYRLIRHPTKPKLIGNNVGIWRRDYERVNGYDENFEGWGCEDDDLRLPAAARRRADRLDPALDAHLSPVASDRRHGAGQVEARRERQLLPAQGAADALPQRAGETRSLDDLAIRVVGQRLAYPRLARQSRRAVSAAKQDADRKWKSCFCRARADSAARPTATCWWPWSRRLRTRRWRVTRT